MRSYGYTSPVIHPVSLRAGDDVMSSSIWMAQADHRPALTANLTSRPSIYEGCLRRPNRINNTLRLRLREVLVNYSVLCFSFLKGLADSVYVSGLRQMRRADWLCLRSHWRDRRRCCCGCVGEKRRNGCLYLSSLLTKTLCQPQMFDRCWCCSLHWKRHLIHQILSRKRNKYC